MVDRKNRECKEESKLRIVFQVVIEAGVIYTIINSITLATFLRNSPSVYVIRDLVSDDSVGIYTGSCNPLRFHPQSPWCST